MTVPSSLHRFMHIEIEHGHWHHFDELTLLVSTEELFRANFKYSQTLILVEFDVEFVARPIKFCITCDRLRQLLGLNQKMRNKIC